jgi:hypothetical protein
MKTADGRATIGVKEEFEAIGQITKRFRINKKLSKS